MVDLKRAYKHEARKYHPDLSPPGQVKEYTKRFIMVREAYEMLSDPVTRAIYDRDLDKGISFTFSTSRPYCHRTKHDHDRVCNYVIKIYIIITINILKLTLSI